jgi:hypothetical protein
MFKNVFVKDHVVGRQRESRRRALISLFSSPSVEKRSQPAEEPERADTATSLPQDYACPGKALQ